MMDENDITKEFSQIQKELIPRVQLKNTFVKEDIHTIAGVDLAYCNIDEKTFAVCCIMVIDYTTKEVIEKVYSHGEIIVPYMAGFLAFRELPLVMEAADKLSGEPDIFMFDGNGYLHPRHMGIATHAAMYLNKPTIGVAKSYLKVQNTDFTTPENQVGAFTNIIIGDETFGRVLRTTKNVKPIFVSCGNWIDLGTSTEIVMNCINKKSRLPIPVRLADLETRKLRRRLL